MSIPSGKTHYGNLSPEYAILGLLCGGPMHGYDLHRKLQAELGQVWHLSQSQAYAILKRLEAHADVSSQSIAQAKLPPRQLLHITESGRRRFKAWMKAPDGSSIRAIRLGFLTRLYFARLYEPHNLDALFAAQAAETRKSLRRLQETLENLPADQTINRLSLEMRVRQLNLVLGWLEDCKKAPELRDDPRTSSMNGAPH